METKFHKNDIVEIIDDNLVVKEIDDVISLLFAHNCSGIILKKENLANEFFDLSTGIAGEILQKFSTYNIKLAIVGGYTNLQSKSLKDFICESNKRKQIIFVNTVEEALSIFCG